MPGQSALDTVPEMPGLLDLHIDWVCWRNPARLRDVQDA